MTISAMANKVQTMEAGLGVAFCPRAWVDTALIGSTDCPATGCSMDDRIPGQTTAAGCVDHLIPRASDMRS